MLVGGIEARVLELAMSMLSPASVLVKHFCGLCETLGMSAMMAQFSGRVVLMYCDLDTSLFNVLVSAAAPAML